MKKLFTSLLGLMIMLSSLQATEKANAKSGQLANESRLSYAAEKVKGINKSDVITEGFEGDVVPPAGWSITDADGDGNNWRYNASYAHHDGFKAITSDSYLSTIGALTPDNFLITPSIAIPEGGNGNVNYWVCAQNSSWAAEHYAVCISTTGTAPADFTTILFEETLTAKDVKAGDWYEKNVVIPSTYAGQTVYIAFRHYNCSDMWALNLDDVTISTFGATDVLAPTAAVPTGTTAAPGEPLNVSVVVSDHTGIASVVGKYQLDGEAAWTDIAMTTSKLVNATYTGTIPAQATVTTGRIKFFMTDTATPANCGESAEYNIAWALPGLAGQGESFEGTFPPADWTIANIDGAGKTWEQFTATGEFPAHSGTKVALHNLGDGAYAEEGLLITPQLAITASAAENNLKFWESNIWPSDYEYHGVMVSTTDNLPGSFTELIAIPAAAQVPTWSERTVDLSAYKGQIIYLAFKYTGTYADGWYVDDAKVTGATIVPYIDSAFPVAGTPTGNTVDVGFPMTTHTVVTDYSGIASVVGHYKLTGQDTWTDFSLTASKSVTGTYTGTIPAQAASITGKIKFTCTDTVTPANTGDSPEFDIAWTNEKWMEWGTEYDAGSGVGIYAAPWWAGVDFDFGTKTDWRLTKIKLGVTADVSVPWKMRSVSQSSSTQIALGNVITSGTINCVGTSGVVPTIMTVPDTAKVLNGHVAIVFDMPAAFYILRDIEATSAHTYAAEVENGTLQTLTSLAAPFTGAWLAGIYVSSLVGIENVEMLPGKSELSQNYPNPFNPTTTINFYNNMTGNVKLTVLNAKGETVTTLINNNVAAGNHEVNFDGARFNSGVYFYKLETPTATITKKMLLVK